MKSEVMTRQCLIRGCRKRTARTHWLCDQHYKEDRERIDSAKQKREERAKIRAKKVGEQAERRTYERLHKKYGS